MRLPLIDFLAGCLTACYAVAALFFLRFGRRTGDGLFLNFAIAFLLLATNQVLASIVGVDDERYGYTYLLRVFAFLVILYGILRENTARTARG